MCASFFRPHNASIVDTPVAGPSGIYATVWAQIIPTLAPMGLAWSQEKRDLDEPCTTVGTGGGPNGVLGWRGECTADSRYAPGVIVGTRFYAAQRAQLKIEQTKEASGCPADIIFLHCCDILSWAGCHVEHDSFTVPLWPIELSSTRRALATLFLQRVPSTGERVHLFLGPFVAALPH